VKVGDVRVVDSHVHAWELSRRAQPWIDPAAMPMLARDHPITELTDELIHNDVSTAVLVQVLNDPAETDDYLWAARNSMIAGVVGWVDLLDSSLPDRLDRLSDHPSGSRLLGIRHQALAEPDPAEWLRRAAEGKRLRELGDRGLVFDLMFRPEHLEVVDGVVQMHPGAVFVLDHAGKPPIANGWASADARHWADQIRVLAGHENLSCKLSGLTTMADLDHWQVIDLISFVDHLFACFGADRLIFGSDWPVSLRAGSYEQTLRAVRTLVTTLSPTEQAAVLGGNAERIYAIGESSKL